MKDLISITTGEFDGQEIDIWTMKSKLNKTFVDYEAAIDWLVNSWKKNDDLYQYFRGNLSTSDSLIIGNHEFVGIDIQDHMHL